MNLTILESEREYRQALNWINDKFDENVSPKSAEGKKLKVALLLVKDYEDRFYPVPIPDPIDSIKIRMKELGLKNKDLVGKLGSKGYVSAILNKRKPMTIEIAKMFHRELNIPAKILLA